MWFWLIKLIIDTVRNVYKARKDLFMISHVWHFVEIKIYNCNIKDRLPAKLYVLRPELLLHLPSHRINISLIYPSKQRHLAATIITVLKLSEAEWHFPDCYTFIKWYLIFIFTYVSNCGKNIATYFLFIVLTLTDALFNMT